MKRLFIGMCIVLTGAVACKDDKKTSGGQCIDTNECVVPWDCDPGYYCDAATGCCEEWGCCVPGNCPSGTFCNPDTCGCDDWTTACLNSPGGCECHILNMAGEMESDASLDPTITLAAGATFPIKAVLATVGGTALPGATFTFDVDDASLFTVNGSNLSAANIAGGMATLTAQAGANATCTADLVHLGQAPQDGNVRAFVFDDVNGLPVTGAKLVVDFVVDDNGDDNGSTIEVDNVNKPGVYATTVPPTDNYTISVFKEGYNYLSVVEIPQSVTDIALPLSPHPNPSTIGGFTGVPDMTDYEKLVLGKKKTIAAGIVAGSFSLKSILNLNLEQLIGSVDFSVDCQSGVPGCYEINIPGLIDNTWAPLPGGVVLSLADKPIKGHFDAVAAPGRRYAWSVGGELEVADLADLVPLLTGFLGDCSCDVTAQCDAGCDCDSDCGLDFGTVFNAVVPLLSGFASGVKGNLALPEVPITEWEDYITDPYGSRSDPEKNYPNLDSEGIGALSISEPLQVFSDLTVSELPDDPNPDAIGNMEAMVVLTGVNTPGFGFVPLGLGAGLDCTTDKCLDRAGEGAADYDGHVNGGLMCNYDVDPELNGCPPGVPTTALPKDHLGVFHAKAHGGLQEQEWVTVAAALPYSYIMNSNDFYATAKVVRGELNEGSSSQLAGAFPTPPQQPESQAPRKYQVANASDANVQWVTLNTKDEPTTRWNVYFPSGAHDFVAPVPGDHLGLDAPDPFGPDNGWNDQLYLVHVGFKAPSASFNELIANNGSVLGDLIDKTDGFSVYIAYMPVVAP